MPASPPILSQSAQMVGVLLFAMLLWPILRVVRERYLVYWAWAAYQTTARMAEAFAVADDAMYQQMRWQKGG